MFKIFVSFCAQKFRCPPGHYRAGPTDCIRYGDCFWTNQCLNGGTCKRSAVTMNATCICPPFFEGALCDIATDRTFLIVGNRDFIIIIIIAIMTLLSKFCLTFFSFESYFSLNYHVHIDNHILKCIFISHCQNSIGTRIRRLQQKEGSSNKVSKPR